MKGGRSALWNDQYIADSITAKAVKFIEENSNRPFFLYFATNDIHVPRVPHPRFVGKSGMGPRGDAILEFDWSVGELMKTLDKLGLTENTIVVLVITVLLSMMDIRIRRWSCWESTVLGGLSVVESTATLKQEREFLFL